MTFSGTASGKSLVVRGGSAEYGDVDHNVVTVSETAKIDTASTEDNLYIGGYTYAGNSSENELTFRASDEKAVLYGGQSEDQKSATDTETRGNIVEVSANALAKAAYGGSGADTALNNTVTLLENAAVGTVYGGYAKLGSTGNTVILRDNAKADEVYGGYSVSGGGAPFESTYAAENTVELRDNAQVTGTVYASWNRTEKVRNTGTIKVSGTVSAGSLAGFDKLELTFSEANDADAGKAVLTLTGSDALVLDDTTVTVKAAENTPETKAASTRSCASTARLGSPSTKTPHFPRREPSSRRNGTSTPQRTKA